MARGWVAVVVAAALVVAGAWAQCDPPAEPLPLPPYSPNHDLGVCVWYGECGDSASPYIPGRLNCVYNGPAKLVRATDTWLGPHRRSLYPSRATDCFGRGR
jgi:hypothetical protein